LIRGPDAADRQKGQRQHGGDGVEEQPVELADVPAEIRAKP
jgi:hypothetical protein